jgi:cold shock CspA family protein/ribosome-associated translation inhibitor RaiA
MILSWRNIDPSPALAELAATRARALARFHPGILRLRATIEAPRTQHQRSGEEIVVHLHLDLPGPDLDTTASVRHSDLAKNATLAVDAAFSSLERQLKAFAQRQRRAQDMRQHPDVVHGTLVEIEPELGWGMVRADTGAEVYVQADSLVSGHWADLARGSRLRFRIREGEKGPFATDAALL